MALAQAIQSVAYDGKIYVRLWELTTTDLTGVPYVAPVANDKTVSVSGTFGGDTVTWEGTLDPREGAVYHTLHDPDGNPLVMSAVGCQAVRENVYAIRPVRNGTAGGGLNAFLLEHASTR